MGDARSPGTAPDMTPPEEVVTRDVVLRILGDIDPTLKLVDFAFKLGTEKGDNFASIMYAVHIQTDQRNINVMLKTLPRAEFRAKMINSVEAFPKEIKMYEIFQEFTQFQKDKGLAPEEVYEGYPKYFSSFCNGVEDYLALEDLKDQGYQMADKKAMGGLNIPHSKLILESVARFHAVCYAKYKGDFKKLREKYPLIREAWMKPKDETPEMLIKMNEDSYKNNSEGLVKAGFPKEGDAIARIPDDNHFDKMYSIAALPWLKAKSNVSVISFGDCWSNNFMFQYGKDGEPISVKCLDFQIARVGSRCLDLVYFLHTSVNSKILNEQEDMLLKYYLEKFTLFARKLGVVTDGDLAFDWDALLEEFNNYRYYGVIMGIMLSGVVAGNAELAPDMDDLTEDLMQDPKKMKEFLGSMTNTAALDKMASLLRNQLPKCAKWSRSDWEFPKKAEETKALEPQEKAEEDEVIITEQLVIDILKGYNPRLKLLSFKSKIGSELGDGYASIMYQVDVEAEDPISKKKDNPSWMVKTLPRNEFRAKMLAGMAVFEKEIAMYTKVFPILEEFQKVKGYPLLDIYPKCYKTHMDGKTDYIALENLRSTGFKMADRLLGMDFDHSSLALRTLAKFHAVSYALYKGDHELIVSKHPYLVDRMMKKEEDMSEPEKNFGKSVMSKHKEALKVAGFTKEAEELDKIFDDNQIKRMYSLVTMKPKYSVIGYGDMWSNNSMYKYQENGKTPKEIKFLDFQLSRAGSRALDINYFLNTSVETSTLINREEELLKIYRDEFVKASLALGVPPGDGAFDFNKFKEEIQIYGYFGVIMGIFIAPIVFKPKDEVTDFEEIKGDTDTDIFEELEKRDFFGSGKSEASLHRIAAIIKHQWPKCKLLDLD